MTACAERTWSRRAWSRERSCPGGAVDTGTAKNCHPRCLPNDLPFSSERPGRLRAYHGREGPRAQPAAWRHEPTCERTGVAFGCCNGRFGSFTPALPRTLESGTPAEPDLRSKTNAGFSADAVSDCHTAVRFECALAVDGRGSPPEHGTLTSRAIGARVQAVISRVVWIDPLCRRTRGQAEERHDGTKSADVQIPRCSRAHRPLVCRTFCRSAVNAGRSFERITAARSRGRSPGRRGTAHLRAVRAGVHPLQRLVRQPVVTSHRIRSGACQRRDTLAGRSSWPRWCIEDRLSRRIARGCGW